MTTHENNAVTAETTRVMFFHNFLDKRIVAHRAGERSWHVVRYQECVAPVRYTLTTGEIEVMVCEFRANPFFVSVDIT